MKGMAKKMNLDQVQEKIEVFYDGRCGMCCTFIGWLKEQEQILVVECYDYHADEAEQVFPRIGDYYPWRELVVRVDGEKVYTGAEGWVCCLWSCKKYRGVACKVNNAVLLPMAKKFCHLVSNNRLKISKLFFRKKNREIAKVIEDQKKKNQDIDCEGGCE